MRTKNRLSIIAILQIVFWVAFVFLSTYSFSQNAALESSLLRSFILLLANAILFYACYLYLIPHYFEKKKYLAFYAYLVLLITVITILRIYLKSNFFDFMLINKYNISAKVQVLLMIVSELIIVLISSLMKVANDKFIYEKKYQESKTQFLESELAHLKAQVSPHFLLNALNNIYSYAVTHSPNTPNAVLKLSEILKYFLYESSQPYIALKKEISVIQAYTDLFNMRFQDPLNIQLDDSTESEKNIEPLILISLVENAFKHSGIGLYDKAFVTIIIKEKEEKLFFTITNSKFAANEMMSQYGGIGLANISKRLMLNYPNKHEFKVADKEDIFQVSVVIPLL